MWPGIYVLISIRIRPLDRISEETLPAFQGITHAVPISTLSWAGRVLALVVKVNINHGSNRVRLQGWKWENGNKGLFGVWVVTLNTFRARVYVSAYGPGKVGDDQPKNTLTENSTEACALDVFELREQVDRSRVWVSRYRSRHHVGIQTHVQCEPKMGSPWFHVRSCPIFATRSAQTL